MAETQPSQKKLVPPAVWCFSTYFAEGFPYILIRTISGLFYRTRGVSLQLVGMTSLYGLPWILRFLWGPWIDEFATKRRWMLLTQGVLAALFIGVALLVPLAHTLPLIAALFLVGAFFAATHDISIDGYYLAALDKEGQSKYLGYRVMAFRVAMIVGTGGIAFIGPRWGWNLAFAVAAGLFAACFVFHLCLLPEPETGASPFGKLLLRLRSLRFIGLALALALAIWVLRQFFHSELYQRQVGFHPWLKKVDFANTAAILLLFALIAIGCFHRRLHRWIVGNPEAFHARAFLSFMEQPRIGIMLAFILLSRLGEFLLSNMVAPFIVDLGIAKHYGWISAAVGLPASIGGALIGGYWLGKYGMKRLIWPFLLAQNVTNLIYAGLALQLQPFLAANTGNPDPLALGGGHLAAVAFTHGFDQFSGGLGTAVLTVYLMRICRVEFKAAHFAIGSSLMSVGSLIAGISSGFLTAWFGYGAFFAISFLCALPGMALVCFVPKD